MVWGFLMVFLIKHTFGKPAIGGVLSGLGPYMSGFRVGWLKAGVAHRACTRQRPLQRMALDVWRVPRRTKC